MYSMLNFFRRPASYVFLPLLAYSLAAIFLVLRLSTPSDGARLAFSGDTASTESVTVDPLVDYPDGLQSGDLVIRVDGLDVHYWTSTIFTPGFASTEWQFGDSVTYTIRRHGTVQDVSLTLARVPVGALISKNVPGIFFLILMQGQALWMWWQRRSEAATRALLLAASAFVSFSICWYIGMDLAALLNFRGLFLVYRLITFVLLMLMSAALVHFALVLPGAHSAASYTRRFIVLIYVIPYPVYLCFLILTYTPKALLWLRRWEFGTIGLIFLAFVVTLFVLVTGYRRATAAKFRNRVRVVGIVLALASLIVAIVGVVPMLVQGRLMLDWQVVPLLSLPIAFGFGIAVVFYQLFDIRIVIQRTLVWGALTSLIVLVYVLIVGALSTLFQTRGSPIVSLIATGAAAILFASVRTRLQNAVNWLLYGERDTPYEVITRLSQRLEQTLVPDEALTQLVQTVAGALKLPYAAIELCQDGQFVCIASWGSVCEERIKYPLTYSGETIGQLVVAPRSPGEALTPGDHHLLTGLLYHAESTIQAAHLTSDLQRSRERLVVTREEERRRLSDDLHDGLGPTLASLILQIDAVRNRLKHDPAQADPLLLDIKTQLGDALADIRRLVYELRPPALDQLGLCAALRDKAHELERASGVQISIELPESLPPLAAAAEVALYRICMEALTNVNRHAAATACTVRLSCNHVLKLEVCDNGCGLPEGYRRGVGLNSMMERASELGGSCLVENGQNGGTRVLAQLPLVKPLHQEHSS